MLSGVELRKVAGVCGALNKRFKCVVYFTFNLFIDRV